MNLLKKKDSKSTEQERVEARREEVLATGRKFKYPLQWTRHRIVTNTILISIITIAVIIAGGWLALYRFGITGDLLLRVTEVIPAPVAVVDGENVRFSDYLTIYNSSILAIERQSAEEASSNGSLEALRDQYKRSALSEAESYTYAVKLARELGITVSDEEVSVELTRHLSTGGTQRSEESFMKIIQENFGLDSSQYRHLLYLSILRAKVEMAIDTAANEIASKVELLLRENGGNYADVAESLGSAVQYEETGGLVSNQNIDGGRASEASKLESGGESGRFVSANGGGYYFVKLISKTDSEVNFVSLEVPFTEFTSKLEGLRASGRIIEYINIREG